MVFGLCVLFTMVSCPFRPPTGVGVSFLKLDKKFCKVINDSRSPFDFSFGIDRAARDILSFDCNMSTVDTNRRQSTVRLPFPGNK